MFFRFVSGPEEFDLPLFGFDFVFVLLQFLLGSDVWVSHRLREREKRGVNVQMVARDSDVCV